MEQTVGAKPIDLAAQALSLSLCSNGIRKKLIVRPPFIRNYRLWNAAQEEEPDLSLYGLVAGGNRSVGQDLDSR